MPTKKMKQVDYSNPPETLADHPFFGLKLDDDQIVFRDAIWNKKKDIVFCSAKAGTGKNLISIATAVLLREYNLIDSIIYITAAGVYEWKQGLLPGTLEQKSFFMQTPLRQALIRIGYNPDRVIVSDANPEAVKEGAAYITAQTDSYIRGVNFGDMENRTLVILDEAQNMTLPVMRTILTRIGIGCKAVVIGEPKQCDLKFPQDSGFERYIEHFRGEGRAQICTLSKSYRSWIAEKADEL